MKVSGFDWDEGNLKKLKKHGLSLEYVEDFFASSEFHILSDEKHNLVESRFIALGKYKDRDLFIVFTFRVSSSSLKIRVISARYSHAHETRKLYEEIKKSKKNN